MSDSTTTTHKRERSPSPVLDPKRSVVMGVKHQGFLLESKRILKKFKDDDKKLNTETSYMLELAAEHLGENTADAHELGHRGIAQLVSTLFEVAAAVTSLAPKTDNGTGNAKMRLLHKHAMEGLEMIGGEEVADEDDDDE